MKEKMNFGKILIITVITIIIFVIVFLCGKFIYNSVILHKICNLHNQNANSTNYHFSDTVYISNNSLMFSDKYVKNNKYKVILKISDASTSKEYIITSDEQGNLVYMENGNVLNAANNEISSIVSDFQKSYNEIYDKLSSFGTIFKSNVSSEMFNNVKNSYFIQYDDSKIWFDKQTGEILRIMSANTVHDFSISFNNVTDNQVM